MNNKIILGVLASLSFFANAEYKTVIGSFHSGELNYVIGNPNDNEPPVVCDGSQPTRADLITAINNRDDVTNFDTSCITDFSLLFKDNKWFNQDIGNWDVRNGVNFNQMFRTATFDQDISKWNVKNGQNFSYMFYGSHYSGSLKNWNVSKGTDFRLTFGYAYEFNGDISNWDVSEGLYFGKMFYNAPKFNQDISGWNVDKAQSWDEFYRYTILDPSYVPPKFR